MSRVSEMELLTVGRLKESYLKEAEAALKERVERRVRFTIRELPDARIADGASWKEEQQVKEVEGQRILEALEGNPYIIALDLKGSALNSPAFREMVRVQGVERKLVFVVGGSLGLSEAVLEKSHRRIRFSDMTFPHQLFRIILLDEIARALE